MGRFFQFGITELFGLTIAVGFGFACWQASKPPLVDWMRLNHIEWLRAVFSGTAMLVALATLRESLLIHRAAHPDVELPNQANFELRILTLGRAAVALLLIVTLVSELLVLRAVLKLGDHPDDFSGLSQRSRHGLIELMVLLCICSPLPSITRRPGRWWHVALAVLTFVGSLIWAALVIVENTTVAQLGHLMVWGIAAGEPSFDVLDEIDWVTAESRIAAPILLTAAGAASLMLAVGWWPRISATWPRLGRWLAVVIHVGFLLLAWFQHRLYTTELPAIIPAEMEAVGIYPWHNWLFVTAILVLTAVGWSYCMLRRSVSESLAISISLPDLRFMRLTVVLITLLAVSGLLVNYAIFYANWEFMTTAHWTHAGSLFGVSAHYFSLAIFTACVVQLIRLFRTRRQPSELQLVGISPAQFAIMTEMTLLAMVVSAPALAWGAYAIWLTPWANLPF